MRTERTNNDERWRKNKTFERTGTREQLTVVVKNSLRQTGYAFITDPQADPSHPGQK